jgi:hypothetical protein
VAFGRIIQQPAPGCLQGVQKKLWFQPLIAIHPTSVNTDSGSGAVHPYKVRKKRFILGIGCWRSRIHVGEAEANLTGNPVAMANRMAGSGMKAWRAIFAMVPPSKNGVLR